MRWNVWHSHSRHLENSNGTTSQRLALIRLVCMASFEKTNESMWGEAISANAYSII